MTAGKPVLISTMDVPTVQRIARHLCNGIIRGTVTCVYGDQIVAWLSDEGLHEEASWVRSATYTREAEMRRRGWVSRK